VHPASQSSSVEHVNSRLFAHGTISPVDSEVQKVTHACASSPSFAPPLPAIPKTGGRICGAAFGNPVVAFWETIGGTFPNNRTAATVKNVTSTYTEKNTSVYSAVTFNCFFNFTPVFTLPRLNAELVTAALINLYTYAGFI
jgi:hypothetical protein